jgi:hypothetical protein
MAGVVVAAAAGCAWQQGQDRGGAVQRLDARLLVHTQRHRRLGRVEVQPTDVADLVDELGVGRQLPGLIQLRLEAEGAPDPDDGGLAHAGGPGHGPGRPVVRVGWGFLQGLGDHLLDLGIGDRAGHAGPRLINQAFQVSPQEAGAPFADGLLMHAQLGTGLHVRQPLGAGQHHPAPQGQRLAADRSLGPSPEGLAFVVGQHDRWCGSPRRRLGAGLSLIAGDYLPPELLTQDTSRPLPPSWGSAPPPLWCFRRGA